MADEVADYMSDAFLEQLAQEDRKHEPKKGCKRKFSEKETRVKPIERRMEDSVTAGLATSLDASNKGFRLLRQMGYRYVRHRNPRESVLI